MKQQRNDLPPHLKQIKTNNVWNNSFKDTGHQAMTDSDPGKDQTREASITTAWALIAFGGFQAVAQVGGTQMESSGLPDWRR